MNIHDLREAQARFENQIVPLEKNRKSLYQLRAAFVKHFNDRRLANMEIGEYVIGVGEAEEGYNFCYTLERQLDGLGRIIGATAYKFGVYYGKTKTDPENKYRFTAIWGDSPRAAFNTVRRSIVELVQAGRTEDIDAMAASRLSPMFKGKILSTYFPDRYLNIFSADHLNYFLVQLDIDTEDLIYGDPVYKREALLEFKNADPVMKNWSIDMFQQFLYTEYPGRPPYEDVDSKSELLEDYRAPEFADAPVPDFIDLNITSPDESSPTTGGRSSAKGKKDHEKEARKLKKLGDRGEKIVLDLEIKRLREAGRKDLAKKVDRVSLRSDSDGYDILSYETDGSPRLIEVKATTAKVGKANFYYTENELRVARENKNYFVYMVYDVTSYYPKVWPIKNPFNPESRNVVMKPVVYKVSINAEKI